MALMDEEEISYDDEEEDEFAALASEVFPDVDPEQYGNLKRMIEICVEQDMDRMGKMGGKGPPGTALVLELGGKPKK